MLRAEFRGATRKITISFEAALDLRTYSLRGRHIIERPAGGGGTGWRRKVSPFDAEIAGCLASDAFCPKCRCKNVIFFSSVNYNPTSNLDPSPLLGTSFEERCDFDDSEALDAGKDVNAEDIVDANYEPKSGCHFGESDDPDEDVESDEEMERGDANADVELGVLDLFDRSREDKENKNEPLEEARDESGHPMVRETCKLIELRHMWNQKLEGELRSLLRRLNSHQVSAVLRSQSDERIAVNFFYWADRQWRYRHAPQVYYTMLELLSKTKLSQSSRRVLRLMIRRRITRRPQDFAHLMVSYSRAGKLRSAMRVLNLMQKDGCAPDLCICNTTIHVLIMAKRFEKALRFLDRMQTVGIIPDVVTYNCLIKGFCDANRVGDAKKMIREMPLKGSLPDKISYYTVISFLCKEKRVGEVRDLLKEMKFKANLIPDPVTYSTVIHVLSKHGHADEALEFFRESEENGFRVDKVGYSAIVHAFCLNGRMEEAKEIVNEMLSKGCLPDVVTYSVVVNGFCRIGKIDQARKMLRHMYKNGYKPNTVTYTSLLNGLCRIGSSLEALEMLNKSEEEWWTPSVVTYSVVMHGLRREGKLKEACELVMQMLGNGFFPTTVEINLLIHALCMDGKPGDAKKFMEDCQSKGCTINVVNFTTVIHGFCKEGDLESALSLLDDMYLSNRHPDVVTYTVLVDAMGKKGKFEKATELVKKMLHRGFIPTPVTYRTVIHRYCEKGRVEDLLKLLEKMLGRQEFGTAYNQVIEKLCVFGKYDEAYKVLGKVLRTASKSDARTCHILMEGYMEKGLPLQSYKVACRMFHRNLIPDMKLCQKLSSKLIAEGHSGEGGWLLIKFVERGLTLPQHQ
ncbi:hypothetical protein B296_00055133 [Ensete ventricosum]|uniref:Pentacotripeptide-repeat region of PRORP domain-containing protein n=1 Tax=Ensete ventricosum TaxID=4639 RepID=A0A426XK45_ENSVE|nr:hypothetical protein B296_00055133 [Ensete ventricosum]